MKHVDILPYNLAEVRRCMTTVSETAHKCKQVGSQDDNKVGKLVYKSEKM